MAIAARPGGRAVRVGRRQHLRGPASVLQRREGRRGDTARHQRRKGAGDAGRQRGDHEVMMRGTFANIRLRNLLTPDAEGNVTEHLPSGERMTVFEAAARYAAADTPLVLLAGREYGSGSSRDWAAKGPQPLGG